MHAPLTSSSARTSRETHTSREAHATPPRSRASWLAAIAIASAAAIALPLAVAVRAQTMPASASQQAQDQDQGKAKTRKPVATPMRPAAKPQAATSVHTMDLPFEKLAYRKSDLPGYQLTLQQCSACHSPEYVIYQPTSSTRAYWQATVDKMVKVFGAPLPADQVAPIVDYLSRTYGVEATTSPSGAAAVAAAVAAPAAASAAVPARAPATMLAPAAAARN